MRIDKYKQLFSLKGWVREKLLSQSMTIHIKRTCHIFFNIFM